VSDVSCSDKCEPWGMTITTRATCEPACTLTPGRKATHTVSARNYGPVAYELTVEASCERLLRYGSESTWAPDGVLCTAKMRSEEDVRMTNLELPAGTALDDLPSIEEVRIRSMLRAPLGPVEHTPDMAIRLKLVSEA
jgi:hypothetical protein